MSGPKSVYHITQPLFDERMAEWGETNGRDVFEPEKQRKSQLLGPDGKPLRYPRHRLGFDLTPRGRK